MRPTHDTDEHEALREAILGLRRQAMSFEQIPIELYRKYLFSTTPQKLRNRVRLWDPSLVGRQPRAAQKSPATERQQASSKKKQTQPSESEVSPVLADGDDAHEKFRNLVCHRRQERRGYQYIVEELFRRFGFATSSKKIRTQLTKWDPSLLVLPTPTSYEIGLASGVKGAELDEGEMAGMGRKLRKNLNVTAQKIQEQNSGYEVWEDDDMDDDMDDALYVDLDEDLDEDLDGDEDGKFQREKGGLSSSTSSFQTTASPFLQLAEENGTVFNTLRQANSHEEVSLRDRASVQRQVIKARKSLEATRKAVIEAQNKIALSKELQILARINAEHEMQKKKLEELQSGAIIDVGNQKAPSKELENIPARIDAEYERQKKKLKDFQSAAVIEVQNQEMLSKELANPPAVNEKLGREKMKSRRRPKGLPSGSSVNPPSIVGGDDFVSQEQHPQVLSKRLLAPARLLLTLSEKEEETWSKKFDLYQKACEQEFRNLPALYPSDAAKIEYALYATKYIRGLSVTIWEAYESQYGFSTSTLEEFFGVMKASLGMPSLKAQRQLDKAKLKPFQPIQDFVRYLDKLYIQLMPKEDQKIKAELLDRLSPSLRYDILQMGPLPETRTELAMLVGRLQTLRQTTNCIPRKSSMLKRKRSMWEGSRAEEPNSEGPSTRGSFQAYRAAMKRASQQAKISNNVSGVVGDREKEAVKQNNLHRLPPVQNHNLSDLSVHLVHNKLSIPNSSDDPRDTTVTSGYVSDLYLCGSSGTSSSDPNTMQGNLQMKSLGGVYSDASAIESIALHLACTPSFHEIILKGLSVLPDDSLRHSWASSIVLPERRPDFETTRWLKHYHLHNYEIQVFARAQAIYEEIPKNEIPRDWSRIISPEPCFSPEWNEFRTDLFRYHELRLQIVANKKRLGEQRYAVATSESFTREKEDTLSQQPTLECVYLLQQAETECQNALSETGLEKRIIDSVDGLLTGCGTLLDQPDDSQYPGSGFHDHSKNIKMIMETHNFDGHNVGLLAESAPFALETIQHIRAMEPSKLVELPPSPWENVLVSDEASTTSNLHDNDVRLIAQASLIMDQIDPIRFKANMIAFSNTKTRLLHMVTAVSKRKDYSMANERAKRVQAGTLPKSDLFHDDLVHAQEFYRLLKTEAALDGSHSAAEQTWERLLAVLAIIFGCTSEPAFFLTTVDRLLDELKKDLGCPLSVYAETPEGNWSVRAEQVPSPIGSTKYSVSVEDVPDRLVLAKRHRCRVLFAELADFVHGCVISAIALTAHAYRPRGTPGEAEFESLLQLKHTCAVCRKPIAFPEYQVSGSLAISVGARDARVGNRLIRVKFSDNRADTYYCLRAFAFSQPRRWCHTYGLCFHYYAELYHPECKIHREKDTARATKVRMESMDLA